MQLAWPQGAGAVPSPILIAWLRQTTGRYDQAIYVIAGVMLVAIVLPLIAKPPGRPAPARFEGGPVPSPGDRTQA